MVVGVVWGGHHSPPTMWHDAVNVRPHYPDGDNNVVFADLEFTGEADGPPHACHVYHIAAVKASDPDNHFSQHIQPMTTDDALQSAHVPATRDELATKGAVSAAQAFSQFEDWLYTQGDTDKHRPIIIIMHNAKIDAAILVAEMRRAGVGMRHGQVGTLCSLAWARYANQNLNSYGLESLAYHYLGNTEPFGASHDALNDCRTLRAVVHKMSDVEKKAVSGVVLPLGYISLQCVRGIGSGVEIALVNKGCACLQQLLGHVQNCNGGQLRAELVLALLRERVPHVAWADDVGARILRVARAHGL